MALTRQYIAADGDAARLFALFGALASRDDFTRVARHQAAPDPGRRVLDDAPGIARRAPGGGRQVDGLHPHGKEQTVYEKLLAVLQ